MSCTRKSEITQLTESAAMQSFQGWRVGMPLTQSGASLTLGAKIEPLLGSNSKPRRNLELNGWPHINGHAGDADAVSTVFNTGNSVAFVEHPEVVGWAPLMAVPFCG